MALVEVKNYSFSYPTATEEGADVINSEKSCWVHHGLNLEIAEGDFCLLVGSTGSGKTTLLRSLKPELAPAGVRSGSLHVCGYNLLAEGGAYALPTQGGMDVRTSASSIGYVMQDPDAQIVCDTVWHEIAFGLENLGFPQDQMRRRIAEIAHFFGIEPWINAQTSQLSGGQKQLVSLASVLALRPKLLLLDEPTAMLDPNAIGQFVTLLARVNRELGVTVVVATHSPEDMEAYVTRRYDFNEPGPMGARDVVEKRLIPRWEKRAKDLVRAEICVEVKEGYFHYGRLDPWVLRGVNVQVRRGSVHAFVGGNGCGKSTLVRVMAGISKLQRGRVTNACADSQALLPQDPKALFVCDSIGEELREWQVRCGYSDEAIVAMQERFGFVGLNGRHPYDLSGGQQQKLALAKLLLTQPNLLFLDEPTKGLDPATCAEVSRIVRALVEEGKTIILVTHDLDFAFATADVVTMLFDGEDTCTEPAQDFFFNNLVYRPSKQSRLFGVLA